MSAKAADSKRFAGIHALVVGLAREGTALARFLAERGARVAGTDKRSVESLDESLGALDDLPIALYPGGHPMHLLDAVDVVFVSPGVPLDIEFLVEARRRGLQLSSETRLFSQLCLAPIVGITGSSGKTTTTALVGEILRANWPRTWVGGNIGRPLISQVDEISPGDIVVMELSSFQLELFGEWPVPQAGSQADSPAAAPVFEPAGWSPHIAALLNITPNHLDRHKTMEQYIAAKSNILLHQQHSDTAVIGFDDPGARGTWESLGGQQKVVWFGMGRSCGDGAWLRGSNLVFRQGDDEARICSTKDLRLLGSHNVANTLAAVAIAGVAGATAEAMRSAAISFQGVEHRLELVAERCGVRWYNDSIATTPERTIAALRSFAAPIVLLAGGRDKDLPWLQMAALTWKRVKHLILFGEAAELIDGFMGRTQPEDPLLRGIHHAESLSEAVELADRLCQAGDVVLLSPGGTSFDAYFDFAQRGNHFRQLVKALD